MANGHGGKRAGAGGKQLGAGRPKKEITDLRRRWQEKWLTEWVTDEDMQYLCQMTMGMAKRGDTAARSDVFKYLLGNPPQSVEVSGPDEGPIRIAEARDLTDDDLARIAAGRFSRRRSGRTSETPESPPEP